MEVKGQGAQSMPRQHTRPMSGIIVTIALSTTAFSSHAQDADPKSFSSDQIQAGSKTYAVNCAPCHGPRMADPEGAFDLRKFPRDQHDRFIRSVTNGKNSMPPWGDLLTPENVEQLWAYVVAGEKQ
jgi:mono/diheme cytochrome c family protein